MLPASIAIFPRRLDLQTAGFLVSAADTPAAMCCKDRGIGRTFSPAVILAGRFFCGFDDAGERIRLQAGAADKRAVDFGFANKAFDVIGGHASAVLDTDLIRDIATEHL